MAVADLGTVLCKFHRIRLGPLVFPIGIWKRQAKCITISVCGIAREKAAASAGRGMEFGGVPAAGALLPGTLACPWSAVEVGRSPAAAYIPSLAAVTCSPPRGHDAPADDGYATR